MILFTIVIVWEKYVDETRHDEQISDGRVLRTGVSCKRLVTGEHEQKYSARPRACRPRGWAPAVAWSIPAKGFNRGDPVNENWCGGLCNPKIKALRPRIHPRLQKWSIHVREVGG